MKLLNTKHNHDTKDFISSTFSLKFFYIFLIEEHLDTTIVLMSIFLLRKYFCRKPVKQLQNEAGRYLVFFSTRSKYKKINNYLNFLIFQAIIFK